MMMKIRNSSLGLTVILCIALASLDSFASDGDRATHPGIDASRLTPYTKGVVYIKFKKGSAILSRITPKGAIAQSAGPAAFMRAIDKLNMLEIVPFDARAPKDSITFALGIDRMYSLYYSNLSIDPYSALDLLQATGEIECGSPRYRFPVLNQPNDPGLSQQWALSKMKVQNAWNTTTGDTSIVIADVDDAIAIDHEDLTNAIKINWGEVGLDAQGHDKRTNGIDDDSDGIVDNWQGADVAGDGSQAPQLVPAGDPRPRGNNADATHGTLTAGCFAATGNNGKGIAGVAYGCKLLAIKASYSSDTVDAGYEGVHYAVTHGANIVNCSWGGLLPPASTSFATAFTEEARLRGVLIVAAAANAAVSNDQYPMYPANAPGVLSVGSTGSSDQASGFSDYGHNVKVWAPGEGIYSTYPPNTYNAESGTSFASPLTAGVAGLVWSAHRDWLAQFVSRQIIQTVDNVVNPSDRQNYWGRVNASAAVTSPLGPGLIVTGYTLDGVASDSLKPGQHDLKITFKNVVGAASSNITATLVPAVGVVYSTAPANLGTMAEGVSTTGDYQITRTGVFSEGNYPVKIAITDGANYVDTLILNVPLSKQAGFKIDRAGIYGSSIKRVSNTVAWAAFGNLSPTTGAVLIAQYANQQGGHWSDTLTLNDGSSAPFDVESWDSLNAYFGTGQSNAGSVIYTNDGGQSFSQVYVSTLTPFVNSIHFFDPQNGILIGDPKGTKWGIGVTTNGGANWKALAKPVAAFSGLASWNNATAWVGDNGWFGTDSNRIYRTTDRGQTWTPVITSYRHSLALAFDDDALHGIACFRPAATSGSTSLSGQNGIMVTADGGQHWNILATLPTVNVSPGGVQFIPKSDIAILTSNMGVFRTTDFGATWSPIGIPVSYVSDGADISISRGQAQFVVSLNSGSNGVATYHEPMADPLQAVKDAALPGFDFSVSPNPAQSNLTVLLTLSSDERVRITITDELGRTIQTLNDGWLATGEHSFAFHVSDLSPGVYYAVVETASGAHVARAITLIK